MDHRETILGIAAALLVASFVLVFSTFFPTQSSTARPTSRASATLSVVSGTVFPTLVFPNFIPQTSSTQQEKSNASTPHATTTKIAVAAPAPKTSLTVAATPSTPAPVATVTPEEALLIPPTVALRAALVNIVCYVPRASGLHSISGSGVIIDPKGFILTNAHIAQYFLLANRGVACIIRSGSPAVKSYEAKLAFISPNWLHENPTVLTQSMPRGTGEFDFALLAITGTVTPVTLPASFPYVPLASEPPTEGTPVVIASYAAQYLDSNQIETSLYPTVVFSSVKNIFTFAIDTIDVLDLGGSIAAQEGSSGGGVVSASVVLVGMLTTSTVQGEVATRSLHAITASYIRAEYESEAGGPLDRLLSESPPAVAANFASKIPYLEPIITAALP